MAKFGKKLVKRDLVESQFGNISVRKGEKMLITKRGIALDEIYKEGVVELDIEKSSYLDRIASSETIVHRTIYKNTPAFAIIHAHPVFAVIESMLVDTKTIIPINIEGEHFLHEIPVVKGAPGTAELADNTAQALIGHKGAVICGHGTFAIGKTLDEAYFVTALVEQSCKLKYYFDMAKK
ncbi:MAG: aldolase [Candidatus Methanoperedens sp.]|nr:aldolase [Candidatus Methanoperedens sp.]